MQNIIEHLKEKPLIWDGPMGTMIYSKGIFINTCYDELSLTKPELITGIHEEYRGAGANILETNTFGANRIKLKEFGIEEKIVSINRISVELAKKVAGTDTYVAGAVGPCSRHGDTYLEKNHDTYYNAFAEQCTALSDAGVDFIQLETFSNLQELVVAARAAKNTGL
ncbi:MAG: bifunctional homocysteine S-methyltransferase/methylenetetrahydrofolate reductase, partial [Deltaproteobacteria bacterium]|nr:bifunctional homocysteine S-methyltransferase/methylenetetrahydrofolate reductase [Deltaproteobacteria bacterium]